jgi:hypothetical protein
VESYNEMRGKTNSSQRTGMDNQDMGWGIEGRPKHAIGNHRP